MGDQRKDTLSDTKNVWVFVEQDGGTLAEVSLELMAKGRELADRLGSQVWAVLLGAEVSGLTKDLVARGADRVLLAEHEELRLYRTLPYARVLTGLIEMRSPYILLFGATPVGRDLGPRVASASRSGLTADCTDLQIGDFDSKKDKTVYKDLLLQIRPAFGGNLIATIVNPNHRPQMATVREGVMRLAEPDPKRRGEVERITCAFEPSDFALTVLSRELRESRVRLKDSSVIVAGGAGAASIEEFLLLRELAHVLGGELGASRAAVDAGVIGHEHQVGQTGTTVRPRLYIAAGISGQIQHRAGMDGSNKIIAINTDPTAPIFQIAHYKIVGDLNEVVPMLVAALRDKAK
jgi:electron transfer flavoprotein alpha subunit